MGSQDEAGDAEQFPKSVQENLLTLLYHFDKAGKLVADAINPALFSDTYREVAERGLAYWKKYHKAPKAHAWDLFDDAVIKDPRSGRVRTYQNIVSMMQRLAPNANRQYILDQLNDFQTQQQLKSAILRSAELLERGHPGAAAEALEALRPLVTGTPSKTTRILTTRAVDEFDRREVEWLWYPFFPSGMITTLFGDGAVGKSTVALDIAARITKGRPLPRFGNEPEERKPKGSVLILSKEEDIGLIIRPRLEAAGADVTRVHTLGYAGANDPREFDVIDRLDTTMGEVEQLIIEVGDVRLLIVDPITDFTGKTDIYRDDQVRAFLSPFARIAAKHNLAIVNILHLNKKTDLGVRHRVMGSVAFPNVSRSSVLIAKSHDEPERRYMLQEKANLTPEKRSVAFNMRNVRNLPRIEWEQDWQTVNADDVLSNKGPTKQKQAAELLRELLDEGPMPATVVQERADALGIGFSTLKAAKKEVNVRSEKRAEGWWWSLSRRSR